ncbi:voltage-gated hydrogen channel 1-like [Plectropomus leopardus]|uniref:voltage-gated hydrogen channel 1-like n=1 Tax=Plectropomus leopardus TaxID=160734 RepID=UPI001C4BDA3F|nr:voltage-gated hydrogen channel 1-like [Plectropomus leopardus]
MARYLSYFTTVGDKEPLQWEDVELHAASEELSPATGQFPTTLTFRESLQRLYSSERFQGEALPKKKKRRTFDSDAVQTET